MTLSENVREVILSMNGEFTMEDLIAKLAAENIFVEGQKEQVLDLVDAYLETDIMHHIPLTDKYYV
ncbi:MAG: hypothetical protein IKL08_05105 [Clostridia bacterium]|nr:hypothetical protein [Clostridia bacterium]